MKIKPERYERIRQTVAYRQLDFTVVLEHFSDMHNIGAVLRTCESAGIQNVHIIPHPEEDRMKNPVLGKRTTAGARKWLNVYLHETIDDCIEKLRKPYSTIYCTALGDRATELFDADLTESTAIILGNEKMGVSERACQLADGNLLIPMMGMVRSLNVSVACSAIVFEAVRQRKLAGMYREDIDFKKQGKQELFEDFLRRHELQYKGRKPKRED